MLVSLSAAHNKPTILSRIQENFSTCVYSHPLGNICLEKTKQSDSEKRKTTSLTWCNTSVQSIFTSVSFFHSLSLAETTGLDSREPLETRFCFFLLIRPTRASESECERQRKKKDIQAKIFRISDAPRMKTKSHAYKKVFRCVTCVFSFCSFIRVLFFVYTVHFLHRINMTNNWNVSWTSLYVYRKMFPPLHVSLFNMFHLCYHYNASPAEIWKCFHDFCWRTFALQRTKMWRLNKMFSFITIDSINWRRLNSFNFWGNFLHFIVFMWIWRPSWTFFPLSWNDRYWHFN